MPDSVYRVTEIIGTSSQSWESAAKTAVQYPAERGDGAVLSLGGGRGLQLDAGCLHLLDGLLAGGFVNRGAKVDQDAHLELVLACVERARPHAVVGRDPAHV